MAPQTKVVLVWIPSHEKVDEIAKLALNQEIHGDKQVIWSDLKLKVTHILNNCGRRTGILKSTINFMKLDQISKKDSFMMKD
ncbi:hypothetical protein ElyMa_005365100 [Elysia marginata]|uniref:Uncharacterized protein n=1 Tax=Elysia marginata TaxID=1093978 RepID=A0AAV4ECT1_9GAST|nr:hypothetical protein ElyMa_005365100 [Elysia marginata]